MIKLGTAIKAFNMYAYSKHMTSRAKETIDEVLDPNFALRDGIDIGSRVARKGITKDEFYYGANCLFNIAKKIDKNVKKKK